MTVASSRRGTLRDSARRIAPLAWPVFVGQIAVLAFGTIDTVVAARAGALDLAALAVGGAAYISVFIGLMGVVLAVGPIVGQLFGAGRLEQAGREFQQAVWLALGLSVAGCALLLFPEPFLRISRVSPEVEAKVRDYLAALAFALPPALVFTAFRGFNNAVSRPKTVMALQLGALLVKLPLTIALVFGAALPAPIGELRLQALGAPGCGMATAIVMIGQVMAAWLVLRRDPFYARFGVSRGFSAPNRASLAALLRLGVPIGLSIAIEVTGFTFMALFIARIGATPVAGHQIAINMVSMMYMMPMAIANATSTLVAQRIGADDPRDGRRLGWHGLQVGVLVGAAFGSAVYLLRVPIVTAYTRDPAVIAAALPLLAWVAVFHIADAAQAVASFVLRAYRYATVPMLIYAVAIWGVGMGGGYVAAFNVGGWSPAALQGAQGFWAAATLGLVVAAGALTGFLAWLLRQQRRSERRAPGTGAVVVAVGPPG